MQVNICGHVFNVTGIPATPFGEASEYQARWFWKQVEDGIWEPETLKVVRMMASPLATMIDIGAWIGPITLYASRLYKNVVSYEPDPYAYQTLLVNTDLNEAKNIRLHREAVTVPGDDRSLVYHDGAGSSMSSFIRDVPNNITETRVSVKKIPFKTVLSEPNVALIKMDVEGYEYDLLTSEHVPIAPIWLSIHGPWLTMDQITKLAARISDKYIVVDSKLNLSAIVPAVCKADFTTHLLVPKFLSSLLVQY